MTRLIIVRHGQASIHREDYDCLSDLGMQQAKKLGEYWLSLEKSFERVYVGPKKRHRQTMSAVAEVYRHNGLNFPEPTPLEEFDEHQGASVVKKLLADELDGHKAVLPQGLAQKGQEAILEYFRKFQEITRSWAKSELNVPEFESWRAFRNRIQTGLTRVADETESGTAVVFTSGGPMAASAGHVLNLNDEAVIEMSWFIQNASAAEFRRVADKLVMTSFNAVPHLKTPKLHTFV